MKQITVKDIVLATGGMLLGGKENTIVTSITYDSRTASEGSLYVPLKGEKVDGHQFIEAAFQNHAACALTSKLVKEDPKKACVLVKNTLDAMQDVAAYYRPRISIPIIGITGSVGKTTTRSIVAEALSAERTVYQTKGNLNSQIGVPVMLAGIKEEDIAVLEMGMSEFGEMDRLTRMVRPDIAIITCIGVAHINQLKTQENICKEKMAIAHGMKPDGILLLNGDDPLLRAHSKEAEQMVLFYGTTPDCDYYAKDLQIIEGRAEFTAVINKEGETFEEHISLFMPGRHNVLNALAALAICSLVGVSIKSAAQKIGAFGGVKMRQQIFSTDKYTVIDDSYNANPDSMKAGLSVLCEYPSEGRRMAILGDMFELGEEEIRYHQEIGEFAALKGVDILLTIGSLSKSMAEAAKRRNPSMEVRYFKQIKELMEFAKTYLKKGDVILVKASRGMALNEVAKELVKTV